MYVRSKALTHPKLSHGFFTRRGGVSGGLYASLNCGPGSGDEPGNVMENRRRVEAALKAADDLETAPALCSLYQIHGPDVIHVRTPFDPANRPKGDAMVTDMPGLALGILTADCTPVLLADPDAGVIGAAHAGWQGAFKGVIASVIAAMEKLGASRDRIRAAIGPTIAQASYEVSADFRANFLARDAAFDRFFMAGKPGHFQFDLPAFVRDRLAAENIATIEDLELDTYPDDSRFFSFRRTTHRGEPDYGRQVSAIALKN